MAKSKIIKELANGSIDTLTALKRAKVLLHSLSNPEISAWLNNEIEGYPDDSIIPSYRIVTGNLMGSYFKGSMTMHMTYNNVSLPLGEMPKEAQEALLTVRFHEGVDSLKLLLKESEGGGNNTLGKSINADFFPLIAHYNNDPYMIITSAKVAISNHTIQTVFSAVENRLLDILMMLEKDFGNLDELDLDTDSKTPEQLSEIIREINVIIFQDNSVRIGDRNTIKGSTISSEITR